MRVWRGAQEGREQSLGPIALTPHLFVRKTDDAVRFYVRAFGAVELFRNTLPDGTVLFVELALGEGRSSSARRRLR